MPIPLLTPYDPRDQMRLLGWLCFQPARFTEYTRETVKASFHRDLLALLLPEEPVPEKMIIFHKLSIGVLSQRKYAENFAEALCSAFDVPDHLLPERIAVLYRANKWGIAYAEKYALAPAAWAFIRYRRRIDAQVQRASGWLGTTLALLPVLLAVVGYFPLEQHVVSFQEILLGIIAFGSAWFGWGLAYQKEQYVGSTAGDNLRELAAWGSFAIVMVMLVGSVMQIVAPKAALILLALSLTLGISYGISLHLPPRHPRLLLRLDIAAVLVGVFLQLGASGLPHLIAVALVTAFTAWITHRALYLGIRRAHPSPISRMMLIMLGMGYAIMLIGALIRGIV
jgi:hypothetical protein